MAVGEIFSPEILIPIALIALLFGGSRIPQFARSLGSAKREFERGAAGTADDADDAEPATEPRKAPRPTGTDED